jgi:hypothetical protein
MIHDHFKLDKKILYNHFLKEKILKIVKINQEKIESNYTKWPKWSKTLFPLNHPTEFCG